MPVLRVHRGESTVHLELPKGVTLLEALKSSGFAHEVESPCGGLGLCGGCSVRALGGLSDRSPREALLPGGVRLACVARLLGDAEVFLDDLSSPVLSTTNGLDSLDFTIAPPCRAVPFRLDLRRDLMAGCSSLEEFLVRACSVLPYPLEGVLDVALEGLARMLSRREGEALAWVFDRRIVMVGHVGLTPLGLAVDLGSSTIEVAAADLCSGEVLGRLRVENRQRRLGVDVVTRITRALEGFSDELWRLLVSSLDEAVKELLKSLGASADRVVRIVVGCNTVMGGFLFKIPPAGLSERPFLPWTLRSRTVEALGLGVNLRCPLTLLPSIGGFVGSDALAFLYRHKGEGVRLLLDLGTNGEVLLWTPEEALGASTAAGPAFEGYGLSCGMPALPGAVHRVRLEDGDVKLDVIGGSAPKGVCGSGLVSSVSLMRGTGILDGSGRMDPSRDFKFQLGAGASLWITQRDVREFQLAKGAVRAAVETLLDEAGVGESQVDLCVVSGLFGGSLQVEDLIRVGMLPSRWKDRVRFSPHGVLEGLLSVLFGGEDALREVEELALRCRHVSLDRDDFKNRLLRCLDLGESDPV